MTDARKAAGLREFAWLYRAAMDAGDADLVGWCLEVSYASGDPALDGIVDRINEEMYEEEFGLPGAEAAGPRFVIRWERGPRVFRVYDGGRPDDGGSGSGPGDGPG